MRKDKAGGDVGLTFTPAALQHKVEFADGVNNVFNARHLVAALARH